MLELQEKTFDDITVVCSPLPAMTAALHWHRLGKCFSPSIAKIFGSLVGKSVSDIDLGSLKMDKMGEAIQGLFLDCKEEDLKFFFKEYLKNARIKRTLPNGDESELPFEKVADTVFQGKTFTLFEVLIWAILEVNYPDFLDKLRGLFARLQALFTSPMMKDLISKADLPTKKN